MKVLNLGSMSTKQLDEHGDIHCSYAEIQQCHTHKMHYPHSNIVQNDKF